MEISKIQYIAFLIARQQQEKLSSDEELILNEWLKEKESNRRLFQKIIRSPSASLGETVTYKRHDFDSSLAFDYFVQSLEIKRQKQQQRIVSVISICVAAVLLALGFGHLWLQSHTLSYPSINIQPGRSGAILKLADGKTVNLQDQHPDPSILTSSIRIDSCSILYSPQNNIKINTSDSLRYHTLTIPRGGEFKIILSDGTEVWLNSESRLKYPEQFSFLTREVYLEGEAYFNVSRNADNPFIVHSGKQKITVLGTSFGVSNYTDSPTQSITLVNGSVRVEITSDTSKAYLLKPGEQLLYDKIHQSTYQSFVECNEYVGWKDGKYIFKNKSLEEILNTLARWYDFTLFFYNEEVKNIRFTGELRRFDSFDDILYLISKTSDVQFTVRERTVTVRH